MLPPRPVLQSVPTIYQAPASTIIAIQQSNSALMKTYQEAVSRRETARLLERQAALPLGARSVSPVQLAKDCFSFLESGACVVMTFSLTSGLIGIASIGTFANDDVQTGGILLGVAAVLAIVACIAFRKYGCRGEPR